MSTFAIPGTLRREVKTQLAEEVAQFYADPHGFVMFAWPWRERGTWLANEDGPDVWQVKFLKELGQQVQDRAFDGRTPVMPVRNATGSGHGVGKSTMAAWLTWWIMSTRPFARGTITANTFNQLRDKTWGRIREWGRSCITKDWFAVTSDRIFHPNFSDSWYVTAQSCKEENSEAFQGQHAANSTSFYIFDESSAVPNSIFQAAEGGLTDGEPMIFKFGNPTRNFGAFFECLYGKRRERWTRYHVDSRESKIANKELIEQWIADEGEDSDFVRVRVRGLPPRTSDLQFIDTERVWAAQKRATSTTVDEQLVVGVDVSRGGKADTIARFRKGLDARSIPPIRIRGIEARDTMIVAARLAEVLDNKSRPVGAMFIDAGFGGAVVNRLRQLGYKQVFEINFGGTPPDPHYANMRAYMWGRTKNWLELGAIDSTADLETDLTSPGFKHDKRDRLLLESKEDMEKRGVASPDDGDALALTFALPVALRQEVKPPARTYVPKTRFG